MTQQRTPRRARREPPREVARRPADANSEVVSLEGGGWAHCARPCAECPWRRENAGSFPAEAFRISARTAHDMAQSTFACHMAGTTNAKTCAGALMSTGAEHNMRIRLALMRGDFRWEEVEDGGADLFPSYRDMAVANGVAPDDPTLAPTR